MNNTITVKKKTNAQMIVLSFIICHLSFSVALTSCSDWDDHYESDTALLDTQHSTLWENISGSSSLSQFASLIKKAGYDAVLNTSQTYTVWAPVDGTYDYQTLSGLPVSRLVREFVDNHIARNNYPASGDVSQQVYTLNEKLMTFGSADKVFGGSGSNYVVQGIEVAQPNIGGYNGVMHLITGIIPFRANIYESLNTNEHAIDSVANYYHSFDESKLNEEKSTQGPMLNGEITYLDSVFDETNDLLARYNAYINREDSNYTMIVPTNEAWRKAKEQISSYYRYIPSFEFMENTSASSQKKITVTIRDIDSLTEAVVNQKIMNDLFYNNNLYDNKKLNLLQTGQTLNADSLYTTTRTKVYTEDAAMLFEGAQREERSNGTVWLTDSLRMRSWTTWNPEIIMQAENSTLLSSVSNVADNEANRVYVTPGTQNHAVSGHVSNNSFIELQPVSQSTNPGVVFYLPSVRSTTYSIYIVTVPANIVSTNRDAKPYRFTAAMGYADDKGKMQDRVNNWLADRYFVSDSSRVDTIYLGDFTFPVAYYGTGNYYPILRINSQVTSAQRNTYDRTMRIDCVILRPKELDDYLKAHPDYVYDRGDY